MQQHRNAAQDTSRDVPSVVAGYLLVQPSLRAEPASWVLLDLCMPRKNTIVWVYSAQALHTHGSTAPAVKSGPFAVLFTPSFAFKHRQVTAALWGVPVLTSVLTFEALLFNLWNIDLMSVLQVSFALKLFCKCLHSSNFFSQDLVWSFWKKVITSRSSSGVRAQEWEE